jgi:hypothetical protein
MHVLILGGIALVVQSDFSISPNKVSIDEILRHWSKKFEIDSNPLKGLQ